MIGIYMDSLGASAMGRIEMKLDRLFGEVVEADAKGDRRASMASLASTVSVFSISEPGRKEDVWDFISRELMGEETKLRTLEDHKEDVVKYLKNLLEKSLIGMVEPAHSSHVRIDDTLRLQASPTEELWAQDADDEKQLESEQQRDHEEQADFRDGATVLLPFNECARTFSTLQEQPRAKMTVRHDGRAQRGLYRNEPVLFVGLAVNILDEYNSEKIEADDYQGSLTIDFGERDRKIISIWSPQTAESEDRWILGSEEGVWHEFVNPKVDFTKPTGILEVSPIKWKNRQSYQVGIMLAEMFRFPLEIRCRTKLRSRSFASSRTKLARLASWIDSFQLPSTVAIDLPLFLPPSGFTFAESRES